MSQRRDATWADGAPIPGRIILTRNAHKRPDLVDADAPQTPQETSRISWTWRIIIAAGAAFWAAVIWAVAT